MHGRSTIETIYLLREIIEKYWNGRRDIHMVFIDLEQMYDMYFQNSCIGKEMDECCIYQSNSRCVWWSMN